MEINVHIIRKDSVIVAVVGLFLVVMLFITRINFEPFVSSLSVFLPNEEATFWGYSLFCLIAAFSSCAGACIVYRSLYTSPVSFLVFFLGITAYLVIAFGALCGVFVSLYGCL